MWQQHKSHQLDFFLKAEDQKQKLLAPKAIAPSFLVFEEFLKNLGQSFLDDNKQSLADVHLLETGFCFFFFFAVKEKVPSIYHIFSI